ncbi:MAG: ferric reductase-like transmembrane domain-containing protein [Pelagibaca sp.]
MRGIVIWAAILGAVVVPAAYALTSPQLQWRDPVYIVAGFAGVIGMALLLFQPLLVGGHLPGLTGRRGRFAHRAVGVVLVVTVVVHVAGLWITSPPDVVDALLFVSPTPFSAWGVIAMWAVFAAAVLGVVRRRMGSKLRLWRMLHSALAVVIVVGTVVHAVQIQGTMESVSKWLLAGAIVFVLGRVLLDRRVWALLPVLRQR